MSVYDLKDHPDYKFRPSQSIVPVGGLSAVSTETSQLNAENSENNTETSKDDKTQVVLKCSKGFDTFHKNCYQYILDLF